MWHKDHIFTSINISRDGGDPLTSGVLQYLKGQCEVQGCTNAVSLWSAGTAN